MEAAMEAARADIERSRQTRDEALAAADQLAAKVRASGTARGLRATELHWLGLGLGLGLWSTSQG